MRKWTRWLAVLAVLAIVAAACSDDSGGGDETGGGGETAATGPTTTGATGETDGGALPGEGISACQVTDTGGIDDRSFNATAYAGVVNAQGELGIEGAVLESQTQDDYAPNIQAFLD